MNHFKHIFCCSGYENVKRQGKPRFTEQDPPGEAQCQRMIKASALAESLLLKMDIEMVQSDFCPLDNALEPECSCKCIKDEICFS